MGVRSMTGFGRARRRRGQTVIECELRTVNHRFLEFAGKVPDSLQGFEPDLRGLVQGSVRRGRVTFSVSVERPEALDQRVTINWALAKHYRGLLVRLQRTLGLKGPIELPQVLALPDLLVFRTGASDPQQIWPVVRQAMAAALAALDRSRAKEGRALARDLAQQASGIEKSLEKIERRSPVVVAEYRERLLKALKAPPEQGAWARELLEKEVPAFAKSCDVSEEVVRMKAHVETFLGVLDKRGEAGRKLDFIAQELHRETNTIGSKSADLIISREVIQMKSFIEKIREQVQNVE